MSLIDFFNGSFFNSSVSCNEIALIPFKPKYSDKENIRYQKLLVMYNEFKRYHYDLEMILYSNKTFLYKKNLYVLPEDLLSDVFIHNNMSMCGIYLKNTLIGFVSYQIEYEHGLHILDLWIEEKHRGKGYFSDIHRMLKRIALISECKFIDLNVLSNNTPSKQIYNKMGYDTYVQTYTHLIETEDKHHESAYSLFDIVLLKEHNYSEYVQDLITMWTCYYHYKSELFIKMGIRLEEYIKHNVNNLVKERMNANTECRLFYFTKQIAGVITIVYDNEKNNTRIAQVNDFYFISPHFEQYGSLVLKHVFKYIYLNKPFVKFVNFFVIRSDTFKKQIFTDLNMLHRVDNMFLRI